MSKSVYQLVTARLVEIMKRENCPIWTKPWMSTPASNIVSGKAYRGINRLLLASKTAETGCPYFASFRQVKDLGGHVKKGAKSEIVVFWKLWRTEEEIEDAYSEGIETVAVEIPLLKYCRVFSLADCENVEWEKPDLPNREHEPHEEAERIVRDYVKNGGPALNIGAQRLCTVRHWTGSGCPHQSVSKVPVAFMDHSSMKSCIPRGIIHA